MYIILDIPFNMSVIYVNEAFKYLSLKDQAAYMTATAAYQHAMRVLSNGDQLDSSILNAAMIQAKCAVATLQGELFLRMRDASRLHDEAQRESDMDRAAEAAETLASMAGRGVSVSVGYSNPSEPLSLSDD